MEKIQDLMDGVGKLQDKEVKRVMDILETARKEIASRVAATEWDAYKLPQMTDAVEDAITTFQKRYLANQSDGLSNMYKAGIDMVDWPLAEVGLKFATPELSATALEVLQGFSADLIQGLGKDAIKKINAELTLGLLGDKPMFQVIQAIGRNLDDKGVLSTIASRAETITRTEMARVNSTAREARIKKTVEASPGEKWMKRWISSGKAHARANHAALDGREVPVDQNFPGGIPYPHAPGLRASESINCGCTHVLVMADWSQAPGPGESQPYQPRAVWN